MGGGSGGTGGFQRQNIMTSSLGGARGTPAAWLGLAWRSLAYGLALLVLTWLTSKFFSALPFFHAALLPFYLSTLYSIEVIRNFCKCNPTSVPEKPLIPLQQLKASASSNKLQCKKMPSWMDIDGSMLVIKNILGKSRFIISTVVFKMSIRLNAPTIGT